MNRVNLESYADRTKDEAMFVVTQHQCDTLRRTSSDQDYSAKIIGIDDNEAKIVVSVPDEETLRQKRELLGGDMECCF